MRDFDPRLVGRLECAAWIAYYRREWFAFLRAAIRLTRHTFGLPWPATLYGSWLVLRANQLWAPYPDNDPEGARRCMRSFYSLLVRRHHERFDIDEAARLEVEWWRVHRIRQREQPDGDADPLVDALTALYAHVYRVEREAVLTAARERTRAMDLSDRWVDDGLRPGEPAAHRRARSARALVRALLSAVHR